MKSINPIYSNGFQTILQDFTSISAQCPLHSARLEKVLDDAFRENDPEKLKRTLALVIVHDGEVIAERYAPEITPQTPLAGWSMTKSVMNTLVGILVQEGKLSLQDQRLMPQWQQANDPRSQITLEQLLHMSSGLKFEDNKRNPLSDLVIMLFGSRNSADYAANKPLAFRPGSHWAYSSGTTNIISQLIRQRIGGTDTDYWTFPRRKLFDRLGMSNSIIEPDAAGNFVGSSFMYASARDWARFGLLYLQDGVGQGERILPPNWVHYSVTPAPHSPDQIYGAHFWRRISSESGKSLPPEGLLPSDTFHASGFQGQFVTIITSKKLVIVRLGVSQAGAWNHEFFVQQILEAVASTPENPCV
ncbi:MAG: serine hydrolase domain-containing protein [Prochloraceae cyanobacterium]